MPYSHITEKLFGLQDIIIKNIEEDSKTKYIYAQMPRKPHQCPSCGIMTDKIHDYRQQKIKDIPMQGKHTYIILNKRRYVCPHCKKRFYESVPFVPKKHQMTQRLMIHTIERLNNVYSFKSVGKDLNISVSTVIRIFDILAFPRPQKLPEVVAIDEFKGNTGDDEYQSIITNPETGEVIDILPKRYASYLIEYFRSYPRENRDQVKYFISDMWKPFADTARVFLPKAVQIVDKYHFIRQIIWAFEAVRKAEQKKYGDKNRLLFKRSKGILTKRYSELKPDEKERVNAILYISKELRIAHQLKEQFYEVVDCTNRKDARDKMLQWIYDAQESGIDRYIKCSSTLINWQTGILNSFDVPYTNGFTEGCNNKIKVLKRNAYGYRNFERFRKRILYMFMDKKQHKNVAA